MELKLPSYMIAFLEPRSKALGISQQAYIKIMIKEFMRLGIEFEKEER